MTETQVIILLDIIISINVFIQTAWFYLWLKDRQANKTNIYLAELVNNNLTIEEKLELIRINTYKPYKNKNSLTK